MKRLISKSTIYNVFYFTFVLVVAFAISTLALYRKINSYASESQNIELAIDKQEIIIESFLSGRVENIYVNPGQHVKKGDVILDLHYETNEENARFLNTISDDRTATEEAQIVAKNNIYKIKSPRDGVVYEIKAAVGSSINKHTDIVRIFSDENIKLVAYADKDLYSQVQRSTQMQVFSERYQQIYSVSYESAARVEKFEEFSEPKYELIFSFADKDEGSAFLDGERLKVIPGNTELAKIKPEQRIVDFWNTFLIGK